MLINWWSRVCKWSIDHFLRKQLWTTDYITSIGGVLLWLHGLLHIWTNLNDLTTIACVLWSVWMQMQIRPLLIDGLLANSVQMTGGHLSITSLRSVCAWVAIGPTIWMWCCFMDHSRIPIRRQVMSCCWCVSISRHWRRRVVISPRHKRRPAPLR